MIIITVILVGVALVVGFILEDTYSTISKWFKARRKFTCAVCELKYRRREGFASLPLDADVSTTVGQPYVIPLNVIACKRCVPFA